MNTLILFAILNVLNVIIQTVKSLVTIKCGKVAASLVNALAYGLYTIVLVYMSCELSLWAKVAIVGGANLIGVYIVKYLEEKGRKDKLWKIEFSVKNGYLEDVINELTINDISNNFTVFNNNVTFTTFAESQEKSQIINNIVTKYNAKYFITETKNF